jgi:hypothetical protein
MAASLRAGNGNRRVGAHCRFVQKTHRNRAATLTVSATGNDREQLGHQRCPRKVTLVAGPGPHRSVGPGLFHEPRQSEKKPDIVGGQASPMEKPRPSTKRRPGHPHNALAWEFPSRNKWPSMPQSGFAVRLRQALAAVK